MLKKRIYLLVESISREIDSRILFSLFFAKKNWSVVIGSKNKIIFFSKFFQRGIVIFKGAGKKNLKLINKLKSYGNKIVCADEEGLTLTSKKTVNQRVDKRCLEKMDYFFCFGKRDQKIIKKENPKHVKKILSIGNMRFDLLKRKYRSFYNDDIAEINQKYKNFILITTKFTGANNFELIKKRVEKQISYPKKKIINLDVNFIRAEYNFQKKMFNQYISFLSYFSKKNPKINIGIRIHPAENKKTWYKFANKFSNIFIADEKYSTNAWIGASQFIISTNSHTLIEASLMNKLSVNFATKKIPLIENTLFNTVSIRASSKRELENLINRILSKKIKFSNNSHKKIRKEYFQNIDNTMMENSNYFLKALSEKIDDNKDKFSNKFSLNVLRVVTIFRNFKNRILSGFKENQNQLELLQKNKFSGLSKKDLVRKSSKFKFAKDENSININEIYPGCFSIEKKN